MVTSYLALAAMLSPVMASDLDKGAEIKVMRVIDGKLYVGGTFERANRKLVNNVAVWDGTAWKGLGKGVDGKVYDICAVGTKIYVCGDFSYVNKSSESEGTPANRIACWDGTKWSKIADRPVDREIYALATDGKNLYLGGNFTKINDATETRSIAKYDGTKITPLGGKFDRGIMSLLWTGGKLYAGGIFVSNGDDEIKHMAVWDGKEWSEVGNGGLSGTVHSLSTDGKNIFAAGDFGVGGSSGIAQFDGSKWTNVLKTGGPTQWVHWQDGKLYAAGDFSTANGKNSYNVAIWDGKSLVTLDEVMYSHHTALMPFGDSVVIGGRYGDVQADGLGGVLKWDGKSKAIDKLDVLSK